MKRLINRLGVDAAMEILHPRCVDVVCGGCNRIFKTYRRRTNYRNVKYCSRECYQLAISKKTTQQPIGEINFDFTFIKNLQPDLPGKWKANQNVGLWL